jgi:hypothetical protein
VKSLELIVVADGNYAPRGRIAGALAALVHLGHPVIAMRTLAAAWEEDAVDSATGVWLISEVFQTGSPASKHEAARLLRIHARRLAVREGKFLWPDVLAESWPNDAPAGARMHIIRSIVELILSRDRVWWGEGHDLLITLLDTARTDDPDGDVRDAAAYILKPLVKAWQTDGRPNFVWDSKDGHQSFADVVERLSQHRFSYGMTDEVRSLVQSLQDWATIGEANSTIT